MRTVGLAFAGLFLGYIGGIIVALLAGSIIGEGFGQVPAGRTIALTGALVGAIALPVIANRTTDTRG
jgi:uncharacterized membrane protein YeaQ/YmgE (transglycosylase-associated protein family)